MDKSITGVLLISSLLKLPKMRLDKVLKSKSILIVIDSLGAGGAERVALTLAKLFMDEHFSVDIITCDDIVEYTIPDGVRLHKLNFAKSFLAYLRYSAKLHRMIDGLEIQNNHPYDLILVHLQKATRLMKNYTHDNVFHCVHSTFSQSAFKNKRGIKKYLRKRKLQKIYNGLNIIAVSQGIEEDLTNVIGIQPQSIRTIYNPVDYDHIHNLASEPLNLDCGKYIVHVGRLAKVKRHDILLEAFKKSKIDSKLVIVGDGPEKEHLLELINTLKIEDKVILVGFRSNPYPIIKNAELLVLSSEYEGLPTVLVEALMLGTKVVSTDCKSGPREILAGELEYYLALVNNSNDLAEKISSAYAKEISITRNKFEKFIPVTIMREYLSL